MHRILFILAVLPAALPVAAQAPAAMAPAKTTEATASEPSARDIVERSLDNMRLSGAEMISTLTIANASGQTRVRKLATISKTYPDGSEKRLVRFVAPADVKGTGLLTVDYEEKADDVWLFMPALRKTRRIVSTERAKSFMGSEFTYADVTPPPLDDFVFALKGSEQADGVDCWIIEEKTRDDSVADENGFSRRVAWVGKKDFVRRKVVYYDLDGEPHREMTATRVELVDAGSQHYRPMQMKMVNTQNGRSSELNIDKLQLRADVPDEYFTTRYLERQ